MYPLAVGAPQWGASEGWLNLISKNDSDRHSFRCPNEKVCDFSYSLNCVQIYNRTHARGSWRTSELDRMISSPSCFIMVEESDSAFFDPKDSDQDNYTQNVCRFMQGDPKHGKSGTPMLYVDGHAQVEKRFDIFRMTYFSDEMREWYSEWF